MAAAAAPAPRHAARITDLVGETPIVKVNKLAPPHVNMYVKVESFNPLGSVKDRLALGIIEDAERRGELKPGMTVIEATGGNTGIGLAMVCASKGYPLVCVMSETFSEERRRIARFLGARVVLTPAALAGFGMVAKAESLAREHGWFLTRQFANDANAQYHTRTTGQEILRDFEGARLDYFVSGYGSGGTVTGVARALKAARPSVKVMVAEPHDAPVLASGIRSDYDANGTATEAHPAFRPHPVQGWTPDFVPRVLETAREAQLLDGVVPVTGEQALQYSRLLAQREGIFVGISSGATFAAALALAEEAPAGANILCMLPDTGERYLSTALFAQIPAEMNAEEWDISNSTDYARFTDSPKSATSGAASNSSDSNSNSNGAATPSSSGFLTGTDATPAHDDPLRSIPDADTTSDADASAASSGRATPAAAAQAVAPLPTASLPTLHIIYENADWLPPLTRVLDARGIGYVTKYVDGGAFDLGAAPERGVYWNRLSPSAHTRDHVYAQASGRAYLKYLESFGCEVVNGSASWDVELSKWLQLLALREAGVRTPRTVLVTGGKAELAAAGAAFGFPFIYKYNCGGKGLGVELVRDAADFDAFLAAGSYEASPDSHHLLQQYVVSPSGSIRRYEFIDGKFHYAVRVETGGDFQLCPADVCQKPTDDAGAGAGSGAGTGPKITFGACPVAAESATAGAKGPKFSVDDAPDRALIARYETMLARHGISVCGIESIVDADGEAYTYDVNCTTNFNPVVEAAAAVPAIPVLVDMLERRLRAFAAKDE